MDLQYNIMKSALQLLRELNDSFEQKLNFWSNRWGLDNSNEELGKRDIVDIDYIEIIPDEKSVYNEVIQIKGIGHSLAESIAATFSTLNELRNASITSIKRINGIGEKKALAIINTIQNK